MSSDKSKRIAKAKVFTDFHRIVDKMSDSVIVLDTEGCVAWANEAFVAATGYELENILGRPFISFIAQEFEDISALEQHIEAIEQGSPYHGEILRKRSDSSTYWVSLAITPSFSKSGKLEHLICTERDISHRKQQEIWKDELSFSLYNMVLRQEGEPEFTPRD